MLQASVQPVLPLGLGLTGGRAWAWGGCPGCDLSSQLRLWLASRPTAELPKVSNDQVQVRSKLGFLLSASPALVPHELVQNDKTLRDISPGPEGVRPEEAASHSSIYPSICPSIYSFTHPSIHSAVY